MEKSDDIILGFVKSKVMIIKQLMWKPVKEPQIFHLFIFILFYNLFLSYIDNRHKNTQTNT